ncbi:MAG TPA: hypothetical protein VG964_02085 [Candidatus Saccharimonadales bacterium]|nr:hypothetical protein [Candidatus Saccharimonadales bacterium]
MRTNVEASTWAPCIIEREGVFGFTPIARCDDPGGVGWEAVAEMPTLRFCEAVKMAREYAELVIDNHDPEVRDLVFVGSDEALWRIDVH